VALGVISAGIIFEGFTLGIWFSGAMALFAGVAVLHSTSNIIHKYNRNQYVAASLDLFASIALMFFYILQMFMGNRD
jgi:FtsH-binding integral membrane protein